MLKLRDLAMQYNFCPEKELLQVYISSLCLLYQLFFISSRYKSCGTHDESLLQRHLLRDRPDRSRRQEWDSGLKDHNASIQLQCIKNTQAV
jgi:hypothetical protein